MRSAEASDWRPSGGGSVTEAPGFVLFDGASEFTGPRALLWAAWHWPALRRELVRERRKK